MSAGASGCEQAEAEERQRGQQARCGRGEPEVGTHVLEQRRQAREHRSQVRAEQDDRDEEQDPGTEHRAVYRGTGVRSVPTTGTVSWIFDIPCDIQHAMVVRGEVARGSVIPERDVPRRIAGPSAAADFLLPLNSIPGARGAPSVGTAPGFRGVVANRSVAQARDARQPPGAYDVRTASTYGTGLTTARISTWT